MISAMRNLRRIFASAAIVLFAAAAPAQNERVVEELQGWAEKGDSDAQFELGLRMLTGEGLKKDEKKGAEWLEKAANQKHLRAQFLTGSLYEDGIGVKRNDALAFEWCARAAENGFAPAQHAVAMGYDLGKGVKQDPAAAAEWLEKAAAQSHAPSQTALAAKYERGVGVAKSPAKAALYYLRAAQQDFVPAMSRLANLYYSGNGVPVDYRRAGAWYQRAARSDDPWAANNIAWFLATCPDETLHNGEMAVQFATRALRIMDEAGEEQRYEMLDTKAAALARNGEYLEALLWQKKSIALLKEDTEISEEERQTLMKEFEDRMKLYQKQAPYTEPEPKGEADTAPLPNDSILQEEGLPGGDSKPKSKKGKSKGTVV